MGVYFWTITPPRYPWALPTSIARSFLPVNIFLLVPVNLSGGHDGENSHMLQTLQRVERMINGVLQCVSHDDPKVDTIITDKADLQMGMFISKTLTTAIIRYNTNPRGGIEQKQAAQSVSIGNMPVSTNVGKKMSK